MPSRNGVSGHAGLKAASGRHGGRASSGGSVSACTTGATHLRPKRKKGQRGSSTSPSPAPQLPEVVAGDDIDGEGGAQLKWRRLGDVPQLDLQALQECLSHRPGQTVSPPRRLHAQDLRGENSEQTQLQTSLSPRTRMAVYPIGRRAVSQTAAHVDNMNSKGSKSNILSPCRTQSVGFIPSAELSNANSYHDPHREMTPSVSACRTAGPIVTEEWSRSIVQPQDEHLLYERHVPWKKKHEERVRHTQVVWLRERARLAACRDAEYMRGMTSVAAAMSALSAGRTRGGRQQQPQRTPSQESVTLENVDLERERTVWMNERHILARGTPLLFTRPRTQMFGSNRNSHSEWQCNRIDMPDNPSAMVTSGVGCDASATLPSRRHYSNNITVTSILHHGFNASQPFPPNAAGNGGAHSPSPSANNKRPVLFSVDTLPPNQPSTGGNGSMEKGYSPHDDAASRPQPNFSSSSLLPDAAVQDVTQLFDNPFFLLRGDENHERLLLVQEEHETRDGLMQLHTTSVQCGHSVLPTEGTREASRARCKHEVSVDVIIPRRNIVRGSASMPREAGVVEDACKGNHNTTSGAEGEARYVLLGPPSRNRPAFAMKMDEPSHHRRAMMEKFVGNPFVMNSGKSKAHPDGAVAAAATRKKQQEKKEKRNPKRRDAPPTKSPRDVGDHRREKRAANASSPPPKRGQPQEAVAAVAVEKHLPEPKEQQQQPQQQQQQLQYPTPHVNGSPVISPLKLSRVPGSPSSPRMNKGAESGRARDAVGVWDIAYPNPESLSRTSSASRSPVRHLMVDEPMPKTTTERESCNATRKGHIKTSTSAARGGGGGAVQTSPSKHVHHRMSTGSTASKFSEAEFWYPEDEQDAELNEFVRFALREEEKQMKFENGGEDDIAGLPGVLWLRHRQRLFQGARANKQPFPDAVKDLRSVTEENNNHATTAGAWDGNDDGMNPSLEEVGHYARNVKCVLTAFGKLWQTPFEEIHQRDALPVSVRAQLLLLDYWPREAEKDAEDDDGGNNNEAAGGTTGCSKSHTSGLFPVAAEQ